MSEQAYSVGRDGHTVVCPDGSVLPFQFGGDMLQWFVSALNAAYEAGMRDADALTDRIRDEEFQRGYDHGLAQGSKELSANKRVLDDIYSERARIADLLARYEAQKDLDKPEPGT